MKQPYMNTIPSSKSTVDVFGGYNHNLRIPGGEFYDMENMTSDEYPVLSPRSPRGKYAEPSACTGIIAKDRLCYVNGTKFVIGNEYIDMELSDEPKTLVSMGAYVIIMPDKKYVSVSNVEDRGDIESGIDNAVVQLSLWNAAGTEIPMIVSGSLVPTDREGSFWIDSSKKPYLLYTYSSAAGVWSAYEGASVRICADNIDSLFEVGDSVCIDGLGNSFEYGGSDGTNGNMSTVKIENFTSDAFSNLSENERKVTVIGKGAGYIQVIGLAAALVNMIGEVWNKQAASGSVAGMPAYPIFKPKSAVSIKRKMPVLDYIIESGNRLWGCRYGKAANGEFVNEIYASKLGDFKNWDSFQGIASDSWVASVGSDGPFTGAITHGGYPLFFKENMLYKVYGSYPSEYQISDLTCRGVATGSARSLAIVNEVLYYHSRSGVCAYDGSLPVCISQAFGEIRYKNAVGGSYENKYYVSLEDVSGEWHLFAYDSLRQMWHREDSTQAAAFATHGGALYYIDAFDGAIKVIGGDAARYERRVKWHVDTGVIGTDGYAGKYILKLEARLSLDIGSQVRFYIEYDSSGEWESVAAVMGNKLDAFTFPILPHRCDHLRLRIEGVGDAKIYSITKTVREGGDNR